MLPDRVSNPGPLTYESGALPIALRGPAKIKENGTDFMVIFEHLKFNEKPYLLETIFTKMRLLSLIFTFSNIF